MRHGRRPVLVVWREAKSNVASSPIAAAVIRAASFLVAGMLCWASTTAADAALDAARTLDHEGRQLLVVSRETGDAGVPAAYCEALRRLPGVVASGGADTASTVRLTTGQDVPIQIVTPGFLAVLDEPITAGPALRLGGTLADDLGANDGPSRIVIADGAEPETVVVAPLPIGPRTGSIDDSLVAVAPPLGTVDTCIVEPEVEARAGLVASIASLSPPTVPVIVLAFREDLERDRSPERDLARVSGGPLTLVVAALLALTLMAWWYARRQELTLYRTFGLAGRHLRALLMFEWILVVFLPAVAGAAWATWFADRREPLTIAVGSGLANVAVALLASAASIGIVAALVQRVGVVRSLKGA